jgi:DNA-binding beta-propeller fold protein YncE
MTIEFTPEHGFQRARRDGRQPVLTSRLRALFTLLLFCTSASTVAFNLSFVAASGEDFAEPHDIVLSPDGTQLYVADNKNHRIVVLDAMTLQTRTVFAKNEVDSPHDVVFDAAGQLLVADTGNARIAIYAVNAQGGKLVGELKGKLSGPEGVAVHADGRVFATGAWSHNLVVFEGTKVVAERGGFSSPHDVAFGPNGELWIADASNDRVVRLNEALKIDKELSGSAYNFSGPRYLDFDAAGRMYVADKFSNQVKVIAPDGQLLLTLGTKEKDKGPGVFDRPEGVEIKGDNIWFSDTYNDRIVRYRIVE